jgi:hypothetical protein
MNMVKFKSDIDSKHFESQLKIFSSSLGGIFKELMETVGKGMVAETKSRTTFANRTGKLFNSINFIPTDTGGVLTTRKTLNKPNVWYGQDGGERQKHKTKKSKIPYV